MPEDNNVTTEIVGDEKTEVEQAKQNVNIQNNLHFVQNIDIQSLDRLGQNNPELANRAMSLYENQFEHAKSMDAKIINLEEIEQDLRKKEKPYQRLYAFLSMFASVGISVYSLIKAYEFSQSGAGSAVVIACISIPVGIVAVNLLGIKNKGQN